MFFNLWPWCPGMWPLWPQKNCLAPNIKKFQACVCVPWGWGSEVMCSRCLCTWGEVVSPSVPPRRWLAPRSMPATAQPSRPSETWTWTDTTVNTLHTSGHTLPTHIWIYTHWIHTSGYTHTTHTPGITHNCIYTHMYRHIWIPTHLYTHTVNAHIWMCTHPDIYTCVYIHMCVYVQICEYLQMCFHQQTQCIENPWSKVRCWWPSLSPDVAVSSPYGGPKQHGLVYIHNGGPGGPSPSASQVQPTL